MHSPFLLIALLYYLITRFLRRSRRFYRTFVQAHQMLQYLAARQGGSVIDAGYRKLIYQPARTATTVEVDCSTYPRLRIHVPHTFSHALTLHRMPRLFFAFAEAFISPSLRLNGLPYFPVGDGSQYAEELRNKPSAMNALSQLSALGFSARFSRTELTLRSRFRSNLLDERQIFRLIDLAEGLAQACAVPAIAIPVHSLESENRCAYCREVMHPEDTLTHCSICKTPHHADCFALNGKCAVFGCASSRTAETPVPILN